MINKLLCLPLVTSQVSILGVNRMIHASKAVLRSYTEWTNELRKTRFTPVEVLALAKGVHYVVVDPNQEALLLPLTIKRYTALLQDLTREGSSLNVLLGPGDQRMPPVGTQVTTEGFVTGDAPNQTSPLSGVPHKRPSLRALVRKARLALKGNFGFHLSSLFASRVSGNLKLKDGRVVVHSHREVGWLVTSWGFYLHQVLGHPLRFSYRTDLYSFRSRLERLIQSHGLLYVARYLKVALFCVHKYLAGQNLTCTKEHGIAIALTRRGLPRIIPVAWRHAIASGNLPVLRLVCSLLTLYKAYHVPSVTASLSPVIQDHPEIPWVGFRGFCEDFFRKVKVPALRYKLEDLHFSSKSGPSVSPSALGWVTDAESWSIVEGTRKVDPAFAEAAGFKEGIRAPLFRFAEAFAVLPQVEQLYNNLLALAPSFREKVLYPLSEAKDIVRKGKKTKGSYWSGHDAPGHVGKLVFLIEAAGKVRTIAIGDNFSQTLLKPLHDHLFSILAIWKEVDGTFDQQGAVDRFRDKGFQEIFSFDLSKATDTIPHNLYLGLLGPLWGNNQAKAWLDLMVDRTFKVQTPFPSFTVKEGLSHVRYTRGQPMGLYSSWGALALLHHLIIQYCAATVISTVGEAPSGWLPGPLPFNNYLVLGDDMVLACPLVASEYQKFCSKFGIELSLSKSFISGRGFFNFASQSVLGAENVSPASARQHFSANSLMARVSLLQSMVSKGFLRGTGRTGNEVGLGVLLRGLYNPTAYKVVVRPSLLGGVVSTPIRLGIAALASFEKFPSLKLASPFRYPALATLTGLPEQIRSIWFNHMKPMGLDELRLLARAIIALTKSLVESLRTTVEMENAGIKRLRLMFPNLDPQTGLPNPEGKRNPGMRYWGGSEASPSADAHSITARLRLWEEYNNVLSLEYEGAFVDTGIFSDAPKLLDAITHDIELILELVRVPGMRASGAGLLESSLTAPWADILEPPASAGEYWGSPGWLLSKLTKEISKIHKKDNKG